ncbi:hypothetical protein LEP1GSC192_0348 [Leptospira sp. B5-022]|nr:hypothetical protein LEP1GSC192_0348 [Leptospira sp. B5-022]
MLRLKILEPEAISKKLRLNGFDRFFRTKVLLLFDLSLALVWYTTLKI